VAAPLASDMTWQDAPTVHGAEARRNALGVTRAWVPVARPRLRVSGPCGPPVTVIVIGVWPEKPRRTRTVTPGVTTVFCVTITGGRCGG